MRKKVMSLQIDYEKMSRRATQERSSSLGYQEDFAASYNMVPDSPSLTRKTTDPLNSSIRSDIATTLMRPENKLEYETNNEDTLIQEQNKTIDMSEFLNKEPLIFSPDPVEQDQFDE